MKLLPLSFYLPKIEDFVEVFSIGCEKIEDKFFVRIACRKGSGDIILISPEELSEFTRESLIPF